VCLVCQTEDSDGKGRFLQSWIQVPRDREFQKFLEALKKATAKVKAAYMELPVAGGPSLVEHRERVYCYELYHQIRRTMKAGQCTIWGEPDKSGHAVKFGRLTPDFIFHRPGTMRNVAVVEVKSLNNARKKDICKDVKTLRKFLKKGYSGGVHLVYGDYQQNAIERFRKIHEQKLGRLTEGTLVLLWHKLDGEPAGVVCRHPAESGQSHA
jgi:hypothetical protein